MLNVQTAQAISVLPLPVEDEVYEVSWTGMDGVDYVDEKHSLQEAQAHALMLSEHGAHCITITDVDGDEFGF